MRRLFREYTLARLAIYRKLPNLTEALQEQARANALQTQIWQEAVRSTEGVEPRVSLLLFPALNQMIDITTERTYTSLTHTPRLIYVIIFLVAIVCAFLAGQGMAEGARRKWLRTGVFVLVTCLILFLVLELEYPRSGLVNLSWTDTAFVDLITTMQ